MSLRTRTEALYIFRFCALYILCFLFGAHFLSRSLALCLSARYWHIFVLYLAHRARGWMMIGINRISGHHATCNCCDLFAVYGMGESDFYCLPFGSPKTQPRWTPRCALNWEIGLAHVADWSLFFACSTQSKVTLLRRETLKKKRRQKKTTTNALFYQSKKDGVANCCALETHVKNHRSMMS